MNDRELLEMAAKAAGIGPLDFDYAEREGHHFYMGPRLPMPQGVLMAAMWTYWRPLEDDGDALRLAVKLQFSIYNDHINSGTIAIEKQDEWITERNHDDGEEITDRDYAATRRAIVRAAAEIGKSMS